MVKGLVRSGVQVGLCLELGLMLGSGAKGGFSVTGQSWDPDMFWNRARVMGPGQGGTHGHPSLAPALLTGLQLLQVQMLRQLTQGLGQAISHLWSPGQTNDPLHCNFSLKGPEEKELRG